MAHEERRGSLACSSSCVSACRLRLCTGHVDISCVGLTATEEISGSGFLLWFMRLTPAPPDFPGALLLKGGFWNSAEMPATLRHCKGEDKGQCRQCRRHRRDSILLSKLCSFLFLDDGCVARRGGIHGCSQHSEPQRPQRHRVGPTLRTPPSLPVPSSRRVRAHFLLAANFGSDSERLALTS